MKQILIADSGGTKTDWCFIDSSGKEEFFTTESYHPVNWTESFFQKARSFWENFDGKDSTAVYFFGAGCFHAENCIEMKEFLKSLGFLSVDVSSDLHSAAISCWGEQDGKVAILGTGSVLFDWENQEIINRVGGKGHLLGDEGSGYYFGKLIIEAYYDDRLTSLQKERLNEFDLSSIDVLDKYNVAQLAKLLKNEEEIFITFHRENIRAFIATHLARSSFDKMSIVGSYGYHYEEVIKEEFNSIKMEIVQFIEKPIMNLVEQKEVFID